MPKLASFAPPGNLGDFSPGARVVWSEFMSDLADRVIIGNTGVLNDSPRAHYYHLLKTDTAPDSTLNPVTWIAFPRQVRVSSISDAQRWRRADASRDVQDEYCEWSVTRRGDGKITKVTFTCEAPEYWELLAQDDPDVVVGLYQQHIDPGVQPNDLFDSSGRYIPRNRWNTTTQSGAMHLVQVNNTLSAEVELAAASSNVRVIDGRELTGEQELINCGAYGAPERNSDPHIGGAVNSLARLQADLALADPIGLYFDALSTAGWSTPDGSDPATYWTPTRGDQDHIVRAVYEVPADKGFTVSDIKIGTRPISFGAQITDFISMKLTAIACRFGASVAESMTGCVEAKPGLIGAAPTIAVGSGTVLTARI